MVPDASVLGGGEFGAFLPLCLLPYENTEFLPSGRFSIQVINLEGEIMPSPDSEAANTLTLEFSDSRTVSSTFLLPLTYILSVS